MHRHRVLRGFDYPDDTKRVEVGDVLDDLTEEMAADLLAQLAVEVFEVAEEVAEEIEAHDVITDPPVSDPPVTATVAFNKES